MKKIIPINVRFTENENKALRKIAIKEERTISATLRWIIRQEARRRGLQIDFMDSETKRSDK